MTVFLIFVYIHVMIIFLNKLSLINTNPTMLALSPPLFTTNIGWPLEDPISHEDQNYFIGDIETTSDQSVFLNFPTPPSGQQLRSEVDCSTTPSITTVNSDLSMVKKLNHNASERDRRKKINRLYASLRALLPASDQTVLMTTIFFFL